MIRPFANIVGYYEITFVNHNKITYEKILFKCTIFPAILHNKQMLRKDEDVRETTLLVVALNFHVCCQTRYEVLSQPIPQLNPSETCGFTIYLKAQISLFLEAFYKATYNSQLRSNSSPVTTMHLLGLVTPCFLFPIWIRKIIYQSSSVETFCQSCHRVVTL